MKNTILGLYLLMAILLFVPLSLLFSQQILNGSFEMNDLDCGINLMNSQFNTHVFNVSAFGGQSEVDLLSDSCDYDDAIDGDYFVALYNNTFSDAISFELTLPLQANRLYKLRFARKTGSGIVNQNSKVEIGLSNSSGLFGESIFISPLVSTNWQYDEVQFSPSETYEFISVRIVSTEETWVFLDDFSLDCPTINLGNDTAYCVVKNIVLEVDDFFESYQWSDLSTGTRIEVNEPGTYWVEARDGYCTIRDTVRIDEIDFNCDCGLYIPNSFSPNNDGKNDGFHPFSPCELLDFQLTIFDRWGQMVYRSFDVNEKWDGYRKGQPLERGVFTYVLQYRFFYQSTANIAYGNIAIIR
ncbi:MAG: gliding motility-associated C-terminal domain-containing protein [Phaeodactylibacter sp.]|nr:gliding motility-associated C-terminal domain-containing protein [Phaeodactylibacter sp.]MCB9300595.1 gliding motility-associated C-terminal domain-containing protein [Lewinellaceae bacterium]